MSHVFNTLNNSDLPTTAYTDIVGIKNLVTTNFSTFYPYTQIIGLRSDVSTSSSISAIGNYSSGKSESAYNYSGPTGGTGVYGLGISDIYATGVYGEAKATSIGNGNYYGVRGRANSSGTMVFMVKPSIQIAHLMQVILMAKSM